MTTYTVKVDPEYAAQLQQEANERLVDDLIRITRNLTWAESYRRDLVRQEITHLSEQRAKVLKAMKGTAT